MQGAGMKSKYGVVTGSNICNSENASFSFVFVTWYLGTLALYLSNSEGQVSQSLQIKYSFKESNHLKAR